MCVIFMKLVHVSSNKFVYLSFLLGDYGKLGHGNSSTIKIPKLISAPLLRKVCSTRLSYEFLSEIFVMRLICC